MNNVFFSTGKDDWETPKSFFEQLNDEFHFTLDPCCSHKNAKCVKHYTVDENGLSKDWGGETVFCNPPYSLKGKQDEWIKKCFEESKKPNTTVVALIPARTDTYRFHKYIWNNNANEIRFIKGRLCFEIDGMPILDKNGKPTPAPFPSMVVVWKSKDKVLHNEVI